MDRLEDAVIATPSELISRFFQLAGYFISHGLSAGYDIAMPDGSQTMLWTREVRPVPLTLEQLERAVNELTIFFISRGGSLLSRAGDIYPEVGSWSSLTSAPATSPAPIYLHSSPESSASTSSPTNSVITVHSSPGTPSPPSPPSPNPELQFPAIEPRPSVPSPPVNPPPPPPPQPNLPQIKNGVTKRLELLEEIRKVYRQNHPDDEF